MDELIEKAKTEGLTDAERAELHRIFLRIALQDLEFLTDQGMLEPNQKGEEK